MGITYDGFITSAARYIGSAIVREPLSLVRSDESAAALAKVRAGVLRGMLEDRGSLRGGVEAVERVIHTAFYQDFSDYTAAAEVNRRTIETIGSALAGSGRMITEDNAADPASAPRAASKWRRKM